VQLQGSDSLFRDHDLLMRALDLEKIIKHVTVGIRSQPDIRSGPIRSGIRLIFDTVRSGPVCLLKLAGTRSQVSGDSEFRFFRAREAESRG
jgi:hypothetical protein